MWDVFKCQYLMQNFIIQSILLCVCFKMKTDRIQKYKFLQILKLLKEHLLNEHDEKQERKENLDMKAMKYESSEEKKQGKTRFSNNTILIDLIEYE